MLKRGINFYPTNRGNWQRLKRIPIRLRRSQVAKSMSRVLPRFLLKRPPTLNTWHPKRRSRLLLSHLKHLSRLNLPNLPQLNHSLLWWQLAHHRHIIKPVTRCAHNPSTLTSSIFRPCLLIDEKLIYPRHFKRDLYYHLCNMLSVTVLA